MFGLPWWLFGTYPSDDEADFSDNEESDEGPSDSILRQEKFSTPSAKINDSIPSFRDFVVDVSKRNSEVNSDEKSDEVEETVEKIDGVQRKSSKTIVRSETEVIDKDESNVDCLEAKNSGSEEVNIKYPIEELESAHNESINFLNKLVNLESDEQEEFSFDDSSVTRDFPPFFSSFNDTTVLFNTTITGDLDIDKEQKKNDVSDWVFKGNKFLEENKEPVENAPTFKVPTPLKKEKLAETPIKGQSKKKETQKEKTTRRKLTKRRADDDLDQPVSSKSISKEEQKAAKTPKKSAPAMTRRHTPSRKAKEHHPFSAKD